MWTWLFPRWRRVLVKPEGGPASDAGVNGGRGIGLVAPVSHGSTGEVLAAPAPASAPVAAPAAPVADAGAAAAAGVAFLIGAGLAHHADDAPAEVIAADPASHPGDDVGHGYGHSGAGEVHAGDPSTPVDADATDAANADGSVDAAHAAGTTMPYAASHAPADAPGTIDAGHGSPQDSGGGSPGW